MTGAGDYAQALAEFTRAQLAEVHTALRAGNPAAVRHALTRLGLEGDMGVIAHVYRALSTDDEITDTDEQQRKQP